MRPHRSQQQQETAARYTRKKRLKGQTLLAGRGIGVHRFGAGGPGCLRAWSGRIRYDAGFEINFNGSPHRQGCGSGISRHGVGGSGVFRQPSFFYTPAAEIDPLLNINRFTFGQNRFPVIEHVAKSGVG